MTKRKPVEPKPCPFCGEQPHVQPWHGGGPRKTAVCCDSDTCYANVMVQGPTKQIAITRWNSRAATSETSSEQT